jgi:hypothetical protein
VEGSYVNVCPEDPQRGNRARGLNVHTCQTRTVPAPHISTTEADHQTDHYVEVQNPLNSSFSLYLTIAKQCAKCFIHLHSSNVSLFL